MRSRDDGGIRRRSAGGSFLQKSFRRRRHWGWQPLWGKEEPFETCLFWYRTKNSAVVPVSTGCWMIFEGPKFTKLYAKRSGAIYSENSSSLDV